MLHRRRLPLRNRLRHARFEQLESRQLLSITLPTLADQILSSGAPLLMALNGTETDGHAIEYTVTVSDSSFDEGEFSATVPQGNTSLRITVDYTGDPEDETDDIHGELVFQLADDLAPEAVDQIVALVNDAFYDSLTFHRIVDGFMIQGGDPDGDGTGGPDFRFDDQFNTDLQFTGSGVLALANSGSDTNGSQFFITTDEFRYGDFRYTIIGQLVEGADVLEQLQNVPVHENASEEVSAPDYTVTITTATTFTDDQNGVLRLSALDGYTGSCSVTVTATDAVTDETAEQTFQVAVVEDTYNDPPYLEAIAPIETTANTPISFYLPGVDVEGDAIRYDGVSLNDDLTFTVDNTTGLVTLTPTNGIVGVYSIYVGAIAQDTVLGSSNSWDLQYVPVYIHPAAPTGVTLLPDSDTGASNSDGLTNVNHQLQFQIDGVLDGAEVQLFANGELIGSATASDTSVVIMTDSSVTFADGDVTFTATQTLNDLPVDVGNLETTVDLASTESAALTITVDTTDPQFDFTPVTVAGEGLNYTCHVLAASDLGAAITYQLLDGPEGMSIDPETGWIAWTPTSEQGPDESVTVQATDEAGNTAETQFTISVTPLEELPPEVTVLDDTTILTSGDTAILDLGRVVLNETGPILTFVVRNDGGQTLDLTAPFANSTHFTVSNPEVTSLGPGESTTFTVTLNTDEVWSGSEQISFESNDGENDGLVESPFTILLSGEIYETSPEITITATPVYSSVGLFNPYDSVFHLKNANSGGYADITFSYGSADSGIMTADDQWTGRVTVVGDWNGDGVDTVGLYDPTTSKFYLRNSNSAGYADATFMYGPYHCGWTPIAGDWDGDGVDTIGLYDPTTSKFYLRNSNTAGYADLTFMYGPSHCGWTPIVGDWNGDGIETVGLYNPANSTFHLRNANSRGFADQTFAYGRAGCDWTPIAGDWNHNGTDTVGLYDPIQSVFYLRNANTRGYANLTFHYGPYDPGWFPIVGDWTGAQPLVAAEGSVASSDGMTILTLADLQPIVEEAIARWTDAGLNAALAAKLESVRFVIADLPGSYLGETHADVVYLDLDAAGHGWFVDPTPALDEEYACPADADRLEAIDAEAVDRIDLLSVVEHELGHVLGLDDLDTLAEDLMSAALDAGIRRNL